MVNRKLAVSIRMSPGDLRDVKRLAERMQVRDSDIIRFAVKSALLRLAPLCEQGLCGRDLVPVLLETSAELFRHFDLDLVKLEAIVNGEAKESERVEREDLRMIAMHGMMPGDGAATILKRRYPAMRDEGRSERSDERTLRQYLLEKYLQPGYAESASDPKQP